MDFSERLHNAPGWLCRLRLSWRKPLLMAGCLLGVLLCGRAARAQDTVAVTEHVATAGYSQQTLQAWAVEWITHHLPAAPPRDDHGTVTGHGTLTLTPVSGGGRPLARVASFDFTFQASEQGYTYAITNVHVVADPSQPEQRVPFPAYVAQLRTEKHLDKTKNDRRVWAQATSQISELAMQFRSYMNQLQAADEPRRDGPPASTH